MKRNLAAALLLVSVMSLRQVFPASDEELKDAITESMSIIDDTSLSRQLASNVWKMCQFDTNRYVRLLTNQMFR